MAYSAARTRHQPASPICSLWHTGTPPRSHAWVSAAAVHDLTDEIPAAVQIAVPRTSRPPKISFPPTVVFRFEPSTFELGLTSLEAAPGEYVRIYDPARTVLDLMRLRHRVGEPTVLAALHRYLRHRDSGQLSCSSLPPRSVSTGLFCMLSTSPAQDETAHARIRRVREQEAHSHQARRCLAAKLGKR
jgi:hypothetical protein